MTRLIAAVASAAVLGAVLVSPSSAPAADQPKAPAKANVAPRRTLDRPLPELHFTGSSLTDVIDFFSDVTGANFSVDWKALEEAKVTKDTPITLRMSSAIPLRKALNLVLQQAGGAGVLTYYVDDGVIQITSQEQADKEMITRIYPIQDLLFQATDYNNPPQLNLQTNNNQSGGGTTGGGGGSQQQNIFTNTNTTSSTTAAGKSRAERAQEIIKLITDTVRPEIWKDNGGTASISFFRDSLIVTAPRSVHEALSSH